MGFSNYGAAAPVKDKLVEYVFFELAGQPSIMVCYAGDTNKAYLAGQLKLLKRNPRALSGSTRTPEQIAEYRDNDRELHAKHVVRAWGTNPPKDEDGKVHPFSPAICLDFLRGIPNYVFDALRVFCGDPQNFVADGVMDAADAESEGNA